MARFLFLIFFVFSLLSCKKDIDSSNTQVEDVKLYRKIIGDYPDGTYCAEVEYYNPNTGTRNTYNLDVEVEDGDLSLIHWSNGGWLDESHFTPQNISSGTVHFTSDRGYRYTVSLTSYGGGCYSDISSLKKNY